MTGFAQFKGPLRSRRGFTQNQNRIWGHCEEYEQGTLSHDCLDKTMFRCDICKQFVYNSHQPQHLNLNHKEN